MRRLLVLLALSFAVPCALPPDASAAGGRHPLFADNGTMTWYSNLAEAQAAARASNRLIFIESGRLECGQCRRLVSQILPVEPIRSRISIAAVGLADDCDADCSDAAPILRANLPGATMLPLCGFVTADLRWVTGWYGGTTPSAVQQQLSIAEDRLRRSQPLVTPGPCKVPGPCATPGACTTPGACKPPLATIPIVPRPTAPAATTPRPPAPRAPAPSVAAKPPVRSGPPPAAAPLTRPPPIATRPVAPPPFVRPAPSAVVPAPYAPASPPIARALPPPTPAVRAPEPPPLAPPAPVIPREASVIERARAAAVHGEWGEVLRIHEGPGRLLDSTDATEMASLVDRANQWVSRSMSEAEKAAAARQNDDALELLDRVGRELLGTTHPATVDAERGEDAVRTLALVQESDGTSADSMRKDAYSRFRGSRWAPLFRSR